MTEREAKALAAERGGISIPHPSDPDFEMYGAVTGGRAFDTGNENGWQVEYSVTVFFTRERGVQE